MTSSTLRALGCFLLALNASLVAYAQNHPPKKTSSISGKITFKGNGIPGITVGAIIRGSSMTMGKTRFFAITDTQGNYRITDLPPGMYDLMPAAPQFVLAGVNSAKRVIVDEGENLDGMDFPLVRGGVISGKVTNAEGQPVIEEQIHLETLDANMQSESMMRLNRYFHQTDDRGMYRIFGLAPGKYTVSAGTPDNRLAFPSGGRVKYKQTFHPAVTDPSRATVIEVTEGSEATNVDIVVSLRQTTYSASGRIIDGETGKPIPNARYGVTKIEEHGTSGTSGPVTNALGEFRLDELMPGKYMVTLERNPNDSFFAESVRFDISDHDVTDLVIKTSSGASVSGWVVIEGMDQKTTRQKFGELAIMAYQPAKERSVDGRSGPPVTVGLDGSFTFGGLAAGEAHFMLFSQMAAGNARKFQVARIERDGVVQQGNLEIKEREQVTGLRLIFNARTGTVQGIVKLENGQIDSSRLYVSVVKAGERSGQGAILDARGRFSLSGLAAGAYEITATAFIPDSPNPPSTKQQIVITDDQVTEVTLTLDLKSHLTPDRP